ncbi:uncharacterized protein LOC119081103 [Bradysia coprophila]|uniref:uncharacterized protein LOC119081103 n=1 Tax=Bradysia coprophila TaxID=38358 RepID=UPI00187DA152|nr:uncharacterized protein LOC119081103 [Bradysia coprophila]
MDGTEFRFVQEMTKNWNKTFKFRDFSLVKYNPYVAILDDLASRDSDMSMCALWLIEDTYKRFDLSTFYEDQCLVLLVPKPMKLNEATAIYTTLHAYVWLLVLFFFLWYIVSLNVVAKIESQLNGSTSAFVNFAVTVIETISAATSHSVTRFPNDQLSVKIILMSWILLSLWLGICYTTIYASRLAKPSYDKPINTIRQVVDHDLYICNAYFDESTMIPLRESANADHRELGNRSIVYGENVEYRRQLIVEQKCAIFEARITEHYVSLRKFQNDLDLLPIYRTFKRCITNHFTGFAFQKYSPYTKLFNYHIRRYQEHGIIHKWETDILQTPQEMKTLFDDYPEQTNSLHSITIINVSGAFFLLGIGLSCSAIIFFVEFVKFRHTVKVGIYNFNVFGRIIAKCMSKIMK